MCPLRALAAPQQLPTRADHLPGRQSGDCGLRPLYGRVDGAARRVLEAGAESAAVRVGCGWVRQGDGDGAARV